MDENEAFWKAVRDQALSLGLDFIGGAISGGVMGGGGATINAANTFMQGNYIKNAYGNDIGGALVSEALGFDPNNSFAQKMQNKVNKGKTLSSYQVGKLTQQNDRAKVKSTIETKLKKYGEKGDVSKLAEALTKEITGEPLGLSERHLINKSKYSKRILNESNPDNIKAGTHASGWAENMGTRLLKPDVYNKTVYDLAKQLQENRKAVEKDSVDKTIAETEKTIEENIKVSDNGKTVYNGEDVSINKIVSTEGGLKVELDNGKTVSAKDLSFGTKEESLMYEMVARMETTPETANELISNYKPNDFAKASQYFSSVPLAYEYGKIGYEEGLKNIELSEQEKRVAYNRGKVDAIVMPKNKADTPEKEKETKAKAEVSKTEAPKTEKNGIIYEGDFTYDESKASEMQKASMAHIEVISKMSNLEVHVFESVEENGERVYYLNGERKLAPNGYFTNGNKIYIDFFAGDGGEGAMLYTMSHEVTHFIRKWNEKGFKELADFLIEQYGKHGVPVHKLLEDQKTKIKNRYERENKALPSEAKLADMAYEELVADAMSDMFTDPKAYEKLLKLKQKNRTLWEKIGEAIKQLLDKLKTALGIYKTADVPVAQEAYFVRGFTSDVYNKLQDLYLKAFAEADANYEAAKNDGSIDLDGDEDAHLFSDRTMVEGAGLQFILSENGTDYKVLDKNGKPVKSVTAEMIVNSPLGNLVTMAKNEGFLGKGKEATLAANKQYEFLAELVNMCINYNGLAPIWETAGTMVFSSMKSNADKQYGLTVDFSTVCKKTQAIVDAMSEAMLRLGRGLTRSEVETIYLEVGKAGESTPCPVCYVFSRWMGIGGILDQISRFQDKYTAMSEASLQKFIADIKQKIEERANTPGKNGKLKSTFFNAKGEISEGQVIADLKAKASSKAASALKAIANNSNVQLQIQELEALMKNQDSKEAKKTAKKIEKLKKKLVDVTALEKEMREANDTLEEYEAYQWLTRTLMMESEGKWVKNSAFKPVPKDILFDLNKGDKFAEGYPLSWAFRTGKGASAGKAIVPYADARVGEAIQAVASQSPKDIKIGLELNPFLNSDTAGRLKILKSAIEKQARQNLLGGQRYQSTSDFRYEYGSDYLITFLEMQAIGAKVQLYTKVIEAVDFLASMGADCNLSVMPLSDGFVTLPDGTKKLVYSSVTGINAEAAIKKAHEYNNVQLILVGISDEHIRLALEGMDVTFVIPFHGSGNSVHQIQALMNLLGENLDVTTAQDYTLVQSDHVSPNQTKEQKAMWNLRVKIVQGNASTITAAEQALLDKNAFLKDLYRRFYIDKNADEYGVGLTSGQSEQIFPYEYWDKSLTYAEADKNGDRFKEYCASMGIIPRFSGMNSKGENLGFGDFTNDKGYWKLLIDRPMYDNTYDADGNWTGYGKYHEQARINCSNFNVKHIDPEYGSATYGEVMSKENDPKKTNKIVDAALKQFEDAKFSDRDSLGNKLSKEQQEFFKDSKVRDADGNLLVVRHGTDAEFNIFDFTKAGKNGKAEGYGFYFSDEPEITKRYGAIQKELYLNITKPLFNNKRTITKAELKKLTNDLIDFDIEKFKSDGLTWQDSFLSNYIDTYEFKKSRQYAVQEFVNQIWDYNTNDQDLVFEIAQADGRMYDSSSMKEFYNVLTDAIGYDGIIAEWSHPDGASNVYVTFRSEQSKNITNKTPTSDPDIRYSLRGTNKDGIEVYETSEEIKKLPIKERQKVFLDIMQNQYRGRTAKFIRNGHAYYASFEYKDINKNIYGDKLSDKKGWKAKIKVGAEGNIFELVENAKYDGSKPEKGKKIAAHSGVGYWDYFVKSVQIDNVVFDLIANVRKKSDGQFVYSIQLNENKKMKASPSLGSPNGVLNRMLNAFDNSISQDSDSVNREISDAEEMHSDRDSYTVANDFISHIENILKNRGEWYVTDVFDYVSNNPELNFLERIRVQDKDVKGDLAEFLGGIDDRRILHLLSWYIGEAYAGKAPRWGDNGRMVYPYRGAIRTFRNAINKRTNEIMTAKVNGTNLGIKNGSVSLNEIKDIFIRLNSNEEIGEFAEKVFATAAKLGVNIRFANQVLSNHKVAGDALGDMIEYKTSYFNNTAISDQKKASTILHELIHACTVYVMNANPYAGDVYYTGSKTRNYEKIANAATRLNRIYMEIANDPDFKGEYGIKNAKEMVAELGNERFVGKLKQKNLWQQIVDWICELFGIKSNTSAYENARMCVDFILDNPEISEYKDFAAEQRSSARRDGLDIFGKTIDNDGNIHYSDRGTNTISNRSLLANALEGVAQNDIEKAKLAQYKAKIALIDSEHKKLNELRAEANNLRFTKGRTAEETKRMKALDFEATQTANRINTYDKQLLNLESTKALKAVLEREKLNLRKRLEQKSKESLKKQKEKDAATVRELMNRYQESRSNAIEGRHKTEIRHKIKNVVSDLNKLLLNPTKDQHVPIGLQLVVAEALDAINMDTMNAEERVAYYNDLIAKSSDPDEIAMLTKKRDFFEYRDANFKERITALKNAYAEFKESDDPLIRNAHNEAIEDLIKNTADEVGNKSLKDMSLAQLEKVHDMYKAILATVRNSNKMFKEGRQATVTENSEAVKTEVKEVGGHKDRVLKLTKALKRFGWAMLKPITAMKVIGSKTFEELFRNVRAAEDTWAVDVSEAKKFYDDVSAKYGYKKWDFKKRYSFKDSTGTDFSISLEQMMALYAYSKREQADQHLEVGGFIFDDAIEVTEKKLGIPLKYEVNDANPYRLGQMQIMEIIGNLTQEQKAFVDEMQTYLSEVMGAKGNEVSLAMYDIKLYTEKSYFPLKTARYFREFDPEKNATPKIKNSGFSKKTVPQAGNPIVLSNFMDVWATHVNDMSMYHAFVLPLEDFMRVYNYSSTAGGYDSVQQYIKNAYGSQANQYIEKLMEDLNGGARVDSSAGFINKGLSLFKKASTFASASVVIQQPSAIARALAYINPKYFIKATPSAMNLIKHKALWAEVKKYAPVAIIKEMGYFDTGVGRSTVEWLKGNQTIKDKVDDILSKAPAIADELAWTYIWEAVKRETQATTNLKVGSEEFFKKSGERFTEIITNTQVYDSTLSRSAMMRSKDTGMKMATAFMAEPTTTVNMMIDGIMQGKRGNKKFTAATVGAVSASIILNSILVSIVYAARDDDDDETYAEKYIGSLTSELIDGFNPLTYIPFVKDVWSIAQGYDVERSDMSVVSNLWETFEGLFNEDKSGWEKVLDTTGAVSSLFGIPLKNIIRDGKGMYNLTKTLVSGTPTTGAGIADSIEDSFKSSIPLWDRLHESDSKSDNLYDAIISGDQNQIDRIKGQYKDEKAIESAMRQALRDNDSRIHEAAQARYEGDMATYTRIAREIIAEGNFSQDTVVSAINAEMSAIKKGETTEEEPTEDKDEATSIYKASDISSALENGDTAMAHQIIDDLIQTKMLNGDTEKEAMSSLRSSLTSYWKPLYLAAYKSGDSSEMYRIRQILYSSGLYGSQNDVVKTTQNWLKG